MNIFEVIIKYSLKHSSNGYTKDLKCSPDLVQQAGNLNRMTKA